jgi:hypothetical protein
MVRALMMVELEVVPATIGDAERVAELIGISFRRQAELLELNETDHPTYVGFQTADGVRRWIEGGGVTALGLLDGELVGTVTSRLMQDGGDLGEVPDAPAASRSASPS